MALIFSLMKDKDQITSMTGFGSGKAESEGLRLGVELRSVNSRYLDIQVRCPSQLQPFESVIRERIQKQIGRGKISVNISCNEGTQSPALPTLDEEVAGRYLAEMRRLAELGKVDGEVDIALLSRLPGVFRVESVELEPEAAQELLFAGLEQALSELVAMRLAEGQSLVADLRQRIEVVESHLEEIAACVPLAREQSQSRLREKIEALLEPGSVNEDRMALEIALIAERSDITEEVVRFRSHNAQFIEALDKGGEVGKRFNFLLQEMNREANTISSKSSESAIIHRVVEIKEEVERLREQVQNLA